MKNWLLLGVALCAMFGEVEGAAQTIGPFNADIPRGGTEISKSVGSAGAVFDAPSWTLSAWVESESDPSSTSVIAGFGDDAAYRFLVLDEGRPGLLVGTSRVTGKHVLKTGWHFIAATVQNGQGNLFVDGVAVASGRIVATPVHTIAHLAPRGRGTPFAGRIMDLKLSSAVLDATELKEKARAKPDPALIEFIQGSPTWPIQTHQQIGQVTPQDTWTLPHSRAPLSQPAAKPFTNSPALVSVGEGRWEIGNWQLAEAPKVRGDGALISSLAYNSVGWFPATVPGTALTTLIDRGVYPDPTYGLNNLAIPESLAHQDYWYRSEFRSPSKSERTRRFLVFKGINYAADIWLNGAKLGSMKGAFIRGRFDVTDHIKPGLNALAIRVSPPPHPGKPQEESLTAGPGENGGMMMLDGPTFGASEGWDWIPTIRDRNTGLWQGVELTTSGDISLGDPQVVTTLPRSDNSIADVEIAVPTLNQSDHPATAVVRAVFDDVNVEKRIDLAAHEGREVVFSPREFPTLSVKHPRLWWPNGYGDPSLHDLQITASVGGEESDERRLRFGMREVTYDLSLMDEAGDLQRVDVDLSRARQLGERIVDTTHEHIRKTEGGWVMSLVPGAEKSPAVTKISDEQGLTPYLVIRVNGVRIAARGGNIGMDDMLKRIDRKRLEPYFKLHRDAHLNIIRNWVGQNTEPSFFDLADEYGLMVLNDFWESTQDYNVEAENPSLFMANAEDVVRRYRNHPSIVLWFGRNEGVPQPILNKGLQDLIAKEDGTRLYMGSSNRINLQGSGPYNWKPAVEYFTEHAKGFSVESGTPSFPTLEAWQRAMPPADRWPISDDWAYHDWHQSGGGDVHSFMDALARRFGPANSLKDFERKAQMMEYESYRAIFEGFNAGLWSTNSGRMLWMTQPAWPSSNWQIFSHDYDTHSAFYGVKKASEPVHVQMNLPDGKVVLVNNTLQSLPNTRVTAKLISLNGAIIQSREVTLSAAPEHVSDATSIDLDLIPADSAALVRLEAHTSSGKLLSTNTYWQSRDDAGYRSLVSLAPVRLAVEASSRADGDDTLTLVRISNPTKVPAIETKLTLFGADGVQVLPALFSDNYVSLLPGESRTIEIRHNSPSKVLHVATRGWNVIDGTVLVK